MGVRLRVGFKNVVGVQIGLNFPSSGFGAHGALVAVGAHELLRGAPLATNCWPGAPRGGGKVVGFLGPAQSPPPPPEVVHVARLHGSKQAVLQGAHQ